MKQVESHSFDKKQVESFQNPHAKGIFVKWKRQPMSCQINFIVMNQQWVDANNVGNFLKLLNWYTECTIVNYILNSQIVRTQHHNNVGNSQKTYICDNESMPTVFSYNDEIIVNYKQIEIFSHNRVALLIYI